MTFIDLTKAFDTMNRQHRWKILSKCGCLEKMHQDSKIPAQQHVSHSPQQWQ